MNTPRIDHTSIEETFTKHLALDTNKRILFSGPFGTGKSTFLKEYFDKKDSDYISLSLYPINYSISSNEDVFELIKFDLLLELITKFHNEINFEKEHFSLLLTSQVFILQGMKYEPIISSIINASEKVGKTAAGILTTIKSTVKDFSTFKKDVEVDEEKQIHKYLESFSKIKGSSNEMDDISKLISDFLGRIKAKKASLNEKVKTVLVIDDLDRLDPEHTFKLFNIFSAHYDHITETNKFGFDKVVFVCDIENIRKFFHHKYGMGVDFSGYINKFYSKEVFPFDNRRFIKDKLKELFKSKPYENSNLQKRYDLHNESTFNNAFSLVIYSLIEAHELNLRALINQEKISIPSYSFNVKNSYTPHSANSFAVLVLFHLLKNLYSQNNLIVENKLRRLAEKYNNGYNAHIGDNHLTQEYAEKAVVTLCLPFLISTDEMFSNKNRDINGPKKYHDTELNVFFHYYYEWGSDMYPIPTPYINKITAKEENDSDVRTINIYKLLLRTFSICMQNGYLS